MMSSHLFDSTIVALATPPGTGAVAVVRLSGPSAWAIAAKLFAPTSGEAFSPWQAQHGVLHTDNTSDDGNDALLDEVLALSFKAPKSFTGEDVVEFHLHGSPYIAQRVLAACVAAGATMAGKGEFSQRAFINGRLDLSQAESILELLNASGDKVLDAATNNLRHQTLATHINGLCETLIHIQSQIVASVDFPDEVDEPDRHSLLKELENLDTRLQALEASAQASQVIRGGIRVALLGRPNAGKSSLFNRLLASERAIVTDIAGTTRDTVEEPLMIEGIPVTLVDTAGLRHDTVDAVESIGIDRSWQAAKGAYAALYLVDSSQGLSDDDNAALATLAKDYPQLPVQIVSTHADIADTTIPNSMAVSSVTGQGIADVVAVLSQWVQQAMATGAQQETLQQQLCLSQRQHQCVIIARVALAQTVEALANPLSPLDLATVPLTDVLRQLDAMVGRDTTEDVLTAVFSQFCVGK